MGWALWGCAGCFGNALGIVFGTVWCIFLKGMGHVFHKNAYLCVSKKQKRMTREEMIAKGLTPNETKHNGHRRAFFHDYNRPGTYMITMVTEGRKRVFGCIEGHIRGKQGTADYPHLHCSALGSLVLCRDINDSCIVINFNVIYFVCWQRTIFCCEMFYLCLVVRTDYKNSRSS